MRKTAAISGQHRPFLGAPGRDCTYIPLTRFQLAGWSKDNNGELDLNRVDEVRVGWGGYLGTEGEKVAFSFALPQMGAVKMTAAKGSSKE